MKRVIGFLGVCGIGVSIVMLFWLAFEYYPGNEITPNEYYQLSNMVASQPSLKPMIAIAMRDNKISREECNQIMDLYNRLQEETDSARQREIKDRLRGRGQVSGECYMSRMYPTSPPMGWTAIDIAPEQELWMCIWCGLTTDGKHFDGTNRRDGAGNNPYGYGPCRRSTQGVEGKAK